jgi:hypothetical protein
VGHVRGKLPRTTGQRPVLPNRAQFARVSEFVIV